MMNQFKQYVDENKSSIAWVVLAVIGLGLIFFTVGDGSKKEVIEDLPKKEYLLGNMFEYRSTTTNGLRKVSFLLPLGATTSIDKNKNILKLISSSTSFAHMYISDESLKNRSPIGYIDSVVLSKIKDGMHTGIVNLNGTEYYTAVGGESLYYVARNSSNTLTVTEFKEKDRAKVEELLGTVKVE